MRKVYLPYFNERPAEIDTLVLHCSAHGADEMIKVLKEKELSAHYIVGLRGGVVALVPEEKRAWHAGISSWRGRENLNHNSVGIEISSLSMGQKAYSRRQINAVIELCRDIIARYGIKPQNIVGHSDIAPERKPDPGKAFPWKYLAENGIGLWYDIRDAEKVAENSISELLKGIGYDTQNLRAAECAFLRHFIPEAVPETTVKNVLENPYAVDFCWKKEYLAVLKACFYVYSKAS